MSIAGKKKGKLRSVSPRQVVSASVALNKGQLKVGLNPAIAVRGMSPGKGRWKA